jgi:hypothetical protein
MPHVIRHLSGHIRTTDERSTAFCMGFLKSLESGFAAAYGLVPESGFISAKPS